MFGYVRPLRDELKIKDYERFKEIYCGLCGAIGKRYGCLATTVLNYEFTFLAVLLDCSDISESVYFRCPLNAAVKKRKRESTTGLERAAAVSVILARQKLRDTRRDERGLIGLAARIGEGLLARAYGRAAAYMPEYADNVERKLALFNTFEREGERSLDRMADVFASLMSGLAPGDSPEERIRAQILYHVGRWIYIVDAADDLAEDFKKGAYNPLAARFSIADGKLGEDVKGEIAFTLENSLAAAASAYELLRVSQDDGILRNILYMGMPAAAGMVLNGTFRKNKPKGRKV